MEQFEQEFTKVFGNLVRIMGLPESTGKILAVLYLEPHEIAMDEVAKRTGYSLAAISGALKIAETFGIIERSRKAGSRKVYLSMQKNIGRINLHKIRAIRELGLEPMKAALPEIIARCKPKGAVSREKLRLIEDYYRQVLAFEKLVVGWQRDLETFAAAYDGQVK